jgi:hypothetical protein
VPLAVNVSPARYVDLTSGFGTLFNMIGLWLVCFVPPVMILWLFSFEPTEEAPLLLAYGSMILQAAMDTIKNLLVTAGMAFALMSMMQWTKKT